MSFFSICRSKIWRRKKISDTENEKKNSDGAKESFAKKNVFTEKKRLKKAEDILQEEENKTMNREYDKDNARDKLWGRFG